jgi:hypothetical protein
MELFSGPVSVYVKVLIVSQKSSTPLALLARTAVYVDIIAISNLSELLEMKVIMFSSTAVIANNPTLEQPAHHKEYGGSDNAQQEDQENHSR